MAVVTVVHSVVAKSEDVWFGLSHGYSSGSLRGYSLQVAKPALKPP